jgi:MFS family permease
MLNFLELTVRLVLQENPAQATTKVIGWITAFVTIVLYPLILLGVLALVVVGIRYAIQAAHEADPETGRIRALVGSLLPIVILVFIVLASPSAGLIEASVTTPPGWLQIVTGAGIGILIMMSGIWVTDQSRVVTFSLYALVLSAVAAFLLYSLIQGFIGDVHLYWLGGILGAGLYTVFIGLPRSKEQHGASDEFTESPAPSGDRPAATLDSE